jgi:hypothetical protein
MGNLGVHFAIRDRQFATLLGARRPARIGEVIAGIEQRWEAHWLAESDKAWEVIHRCLTDGGLDSEAGSYPLNKCILGGCRLQTAGDGVVRLVMPAEVGDVAAALATLDEGWLSRRFFALDPRSAALPLDPDGFAYVWHWFLNVRRLFERAARAERAVLFTAVLAAPRVEPGRIVALCRTVEPPRTLVAQGDLRRLAP